MMQAGWMEGMRGDITSSGGGEVTVVNDAVVDAATTTTASYIPCSASWNSRGMVTSESMREVGKERERETEFFLPDRWEQNQ